MRLMVVLSLLINVAVLLPVCAGLLADAAWTRSAYGEWTPARAILLSIYLAIGLVSVLLLVRREPKAVAALLLLVQVLYKVTTSQTPNQSLHLTAEAFTPSAVGRPPRRRGVPSGAESRRLPRGSSAPPPWRCSDFAATSRSPARRSRGRSRRR